MPMAYWVGQYDYRATVEFSSSYETLLFLHLLFFSIHFDNNSDIIC